MTNYTLTSFWDDFWDDELEQLERRVTELFGVEATEAAVDRASVALVGKPTPQLLLSYRVAVKGELRRLITPQ